MSLTVTVSLLSMMAATPISPVTSEMIADMLSRRASVSVAAWVTGLFVFRVEHEASIAAAAKRYIRKKNFFISEYGFISVCGEQFKGFHAHD